MGWFGGSSNNDGIEPGQAPTRAQRKACWEARDAYYACLDQNGITQADDGELGDKAGVCKDFRKAYEGACGKSWVSLLCRSRVGASAVFCLDFFGGWKLIPRSTTSTSAACSRSGRRRRWRRPPHSVLRPRPPSGNVSRPNLAACISYVTSHPMLPHAKMYKVYVYP